MSVYQRRRYFNANIAKKTTTEYTKGIAQSLCFLLKLIDSDIRIACNVDFDQDTLHALQVFNTSRKNSNDIRKLIIRLISHDRGIKAIYRREALCLPAIAILI